MKARAVIPGWPRGHSVTVAAHNTEWQIGEDMLVCWYWPRRAGWRYYLKPERGSLLEDHRLNVAYHAGQQKMFDDFLSRYRTPQEAVQRIVPIAS